jgi:hypothetical protein
MSLKIFNENELSSQIKSGKDKSNKIINNLSGTGTINESSTNNFLHKKRKGPENQIDF